MVATRPPSSSRGCRQCVVLTAGTLLGVPTHLSGDMLKRAQHFGDDEQLGWSGVQARVPARGQTVGQQGVDRRADGDGSTGLRKCRTT